MAPTSYQAPIVTSPGASRRRREPGPRCIAPRPGGGRSPDVAPVLARSRPRRACRPRLTTWRDGRLQVVRWGNGRGRSRVVWSRVKQGIRGLIVPDERGAAVSNVVGEPPSHHDRIMTGSGRMPVLIGQRI